MGNQTTLIRLVLAILIFCSALAQQQRVIRRIQENPLNIFYVSDWKTYAGFRSVTDVIQSHQYIYFSTDGGGLLRYDKFRGEFIAPITSSNGLISNTIYQIYESIEDTSSINKNTAQIITDKGNQIIDLAINDNFLFPDPLQFGFKPSLSSNHLKRVDLDQFSANFWPPFIVNANGVSDDQFEFYKDVFSFVDTDRNHWLLVKKLGLFNARTDASPYRFYQVGPQNSPIHSIALYKGDLFLGQQQNNPKNPILSVWRENNQWENWRNADLGDFSLKRIHKVFSDGNLLWLGTDNGLVKLIPDTFNPTKYLKNDLRHKAVYDIETIGNRLILATESGLMSQSKESDAGFEIQFKGLSNSPVFSIAVGDSVIMAVNRFGIYKINADYSGITLLNDELDFNIFQTRLVDFYDGKFWFNKDDGIFSYDVKTKESVEIKLFSPRFTLQITKLIVDKNYIFLGTNKGLIIYYANLDEWIWFSQNDGLPNDYVTDLVLDGDYLFIATRNAVTEFRWFDKRRSY